PRPGPTAPPNRPAGARRGPRGGGAPPPPPAKIKTQVSRPDPLVAPFAKYQPVGSLKVTLDDQPVADVPLVALEPVEQAGIFGRAWDAVRLWIK
ncbi:hypothetical protein ACCD09_28575, partial [Variovorax sp. Varisp62]